MNIKEILKVLDKSDKNSTHPDWDHFGNFFRLDTGGFHDWDKFEKHLKGYFFAKWYCSDTWVGGVIYFLDDEFVAVSWQNGRKSDEEIEFVSLECAEKIKQLMISCLEDDEDEIPILDLEEDLGEGYRINYSQECLKKDCIVLPHKIKGKIVKDYRGYENIEKWEFAVIKYKDGTEEQVNIKDILFEFGS